jgi:hypothetical protein
MQHFHFLVKKYTNTLSEFILLLVWFKKSPLRNTINACRSDWLSTTQIRHTVITVEINSTVIFSEECQGKRAVVGI